MIKSVQNEAVRLVWLTSRETAKSVGDVRFRSKVLANPEPSTHGTKRTWQPTSAMSAIEGKADLALTNANVGF
jgi:hypothetical protein